MTQFPISTDAARYFEKGRHQVRPLLGPHRQAIRRLQPYQVDDPANHPLALLNRLANGDKHRLLTAVVGFVDPLSIRDYKLGLGRGVALPLFLKTEETMRKMMEIDPTISVIGWATLDFEDEGRRPVVPTLLGLWDYVGAIIDWFEPVVR